MDKAEFDRRLGIEKQLLVDGAQTQSEFDQARQTLLSAFRAAQSGAIGGQSGSSDGTVILLNPGESLGTGRVQYRLERVLGAGSFGQVWEAQDLSDINPATGKGHKVAIKVLLPDAEKDASLVANFDREAKKLKLLRHAHIIGMYGFFQADSRPGLRFLVMEHAAGGSLNQYRAEHGRLSIEHALALLRPVAHALDYAWTQEQIVHRDLKLDNILLKSKIDGDPKSDSHGKHHEEAARSIRVVDFGFAAKARASGGSGSSIVIERSGGTPGYLAPECVNSTVDPHPRQDVYSLASLLYALLHDDVALPYPKSPRPDTGDPAPPHALRGDNDPTQAGQWSVL